MVDVINSIESNLFQIKEDMPQIDAALSINPTNGARKVRLA